MERKLIIYYLCPLINMIIRNSLFKKVCSYKSETN